MTPHLTPAERSVLETYQRLCADDPGGAFAPYYADVAQATGDADSAYKVCKSLKRLGLLACRGAQRGGLINAPSYWITDEGIALVTP